MNDDDRPIYSDTGYFGRGRPGIHLDPDAAQRDWPWSLAGLLAIAIVVALTLWLVPGIMR